MMTVDVETGKILNSRRFHSNIRLTKRLTFDQVQEFIDGKKPGDWDKDFCGKMKELVDLALKLRKYRKAQEDFLEIVTTEIRALCDEENEIILGLKREVQRQADELVEDCMLAANSEAAKELIIKSIPGIFRIHPEPPPEKLEEFSAFASGTFNISTGDLNNRSNCNKFLKKLPDDHKKPVIINAFLRSLPRACYTEYPELHFGLGKTRYSHFTSPIRRYPDLLVHQQLWSADSNTRLRSKASMADIAADCSKKEMNNDEAYYAANDRMKLQYLKMHDDTPEQRVYEAIITRISSAGLSVDVTDLGIYGFVPSQFLGQMRYQKKDKKLKAAAHSHQNYKCGDFIFLHLDRIDFIKASAIFRPVV
jgi:ribonuclease R